MRSYRLNPVGWTIGTKISVIMALMLLPMLHLGLLFVQAVRKDVDFSSKELQGAAVIEQVWPSYAQLLQPQSLRKPLPEGGDFDAMIRDFKAEEAVAAFRKALTSPGGVMEAGATGQSAIQKVADGSNLTLDPDVDSYYMMDLVTVRIPEFALARAQLAAAMHLFVAGGKPGATERDALVRADTRIDLALAAVRSSMASGIAGNEDGLVKKGLAEPSRAFFAAIDTSSRLVDATRAAVMSGSALKVGLAELDWSDEELARATDALWKAANGEMKRLIGIRVEGMTSKAQRDGLIACVGALIAIAVALSFARSVRRPMADLIATLRRFAENDFQSPVPHVELTNEIGEIAQALQRTQTDAGRTALTIAAMNQSPTQLMITDPEEKVIFISEALTATLRRLEPVFRQGDPSFSVDAMMGRHIDYYRTNSQLKRDVLVDDGIQRRLRYAIDGQVILVDLAYIYQADGERVGHTMIWRNVTEELLGEAQVAAVVAAAQQGDFSGRLDLAGKDGFVREIATGLNNVSALVEQATGEFAEVMAAVAKGDLTRQITGNHAGVLGSLSRSINETVDRLSATVATIQSTAADVGLASREIKTGSDDLSKRTEEQASSLEETAATTEQLAASVKASAQNSRAAARIAEEAMQSAQSGGAIAGQAVEAMARIESASQKISDIIRVIDDIAFQTNLLALNAAVEAARAGDAGKGFAVVASEVRTLAQRSSEAAKDIAALISSSNSEVEGGVKLVRQAGEQLSQILAASQKVAATIADISTASGEQSNGIDEMSQAVAHLDEMTQQNAALAEESAASANALSDRIGQLNDLVAGFRTHGAALPAAPNEPARLREMAAAAFSTAPAPRRPAAKPVEPPRPAPRKVATGGSDHGWEEF
ncbi:methyl-accepting chemotaxis protein [Bosea sp. (in: a-proteobacteria)]|uniref:methyl-accepting chemotaxis protein n=1 Tax=Bosea sp. (in: a-proteobacteria) TaxID=1871050 RepID=UPI003B3B7D79